MSKSANARPARTTQIRRIPKYVVLEKKRGETPLEVLTAWKAAHSELVDVPASYAGRLDPMAEGKLLVLLGEECKKQGEYTKLDKEYEVEVLVGAGTDTGDVLGFVRSEKELVAQKSDAQMEPKAFKFLNAYEIKKLSAPSAPLDILHNSHQTLQHLSPFTKHSIRKILKEEIGSYSRKYPIFSSKTVNGKPLFLYSLEGTLDTITIPEHIERIYSIQLQRTEQVSKAALQKIIDEHLSVVPRSDEPSKAFGADFRQDEVRERWLAFFKDTPQENFIILKLSVVCGSGAYMRTLAERIGTNFGTNALALSIKRTKLGKYTPLFANLGVWLRQF